MKSAPHRTVDEREVGRRGATLLLVVPDGPPHLTALCNRWWVRLMARVQSSSLDRRLADGCSPESSGVLAARAQVLVSPVTRGALAQGWENVLRHAQKAPAMRDPRARLNRCGIIACERYIRDVQLTLSTPQPLPARGMAMMSCILSNGMGPLYGRRSPGDLKIALEEAMAQLDPSVSL
jgi:hypothetical protein